MHIPDNYLSPSSCAVMGAIMIPIWGYCIKKLKNELTKKRIPLLGIGASLSFLTMMFNVPLPGGTTGHAVGGTLLAIMMGPEAACISISVALMLQALLFGDGGVLAYGANSFNMAFLLPFAGYYIYSFLKSRLKSERGEYVSAAAGSYIGINLAALFASIEFGIQPVLFKDAAGLPLYCPYPLSITVPSMMIPHLTVAGILEGIITVGVLSFIKKVSPGILYKDSSTKTKPIYAFIIGLIFLSPIGLIASGTAWGEWSKDEIKHVTSGGKALGYIPKGMKNGFDFHTLMSDYGVKGLPPNIGYILSAIAGVAVLLLVFRLIANVIKSTKNEN